MELNIESLSRGELNRLLIEEIRKFIKMIDNKAAIGELQKQRDFIKSIFGRIDKKEREKFIALFGEKSLRPLLEND
jgi:hypothetical protein